MPQNTSSPPPPVWKVLLIPLVLTAILGSTFLLKLHNLGHTGLTRWDEVYHAVVARNVMKHPLKPTLVDEPYLPYDEKKWGENHVWLHKPILPFWQTALSLAILGVSPFALRLPAALLSTAAAWLTYLIGKELFDRRTGLIAAALQAINPFLVTLVHGYQFADNVDIALLFWVEVGVYFLVRSLRTGCWRDVLLAGLAQGLAFLCKSYLAGIILGIALAAWLLPVCGLIRREDCRIDLFRILGLLGVTILVIAPWMVYCASNYPREFWHEHVQVWRHLYSNVENWAAPWDRVLFDYLIAIYGVFYTPVIVAAIVLAGKAVAQRHSGLWLVYAWGLGVLLPHLFAVTKTPSATLIAVPAFLLLLAHLISEACRGDRWSLAALTAILVMGVLVPAVINKPGYGYPSPRVFAAVMLKSLWVLGHVSGALALATGAVAMWTLTRQWLAPCRLYLHVNALVFCLCVLAWLGTQTLNAAWRVTKTNENDPACVDIGQFVREHLPENAVLLCELHRGGEHVAMMFYADRTCYALQGRSPDEWARQILQAGGVPYVVTQRRLFLPAVHVSGKGRGLTVYQWQQ